MKKYFAVLAVLLAAVPSHAQDVFMALTRDAVPLSETPTNVDVINASDFEKTSALTVADAIANEPGLVVQTAGSQGSQQLPMIRGFSSQQLLVVIDDVPQTPDLTGNVDLSRIPLDNVDRIEIVRGGASAVYGPNAEGGVIHIITKKPLTSVDGELTSEAGSYDTYNNRFRIGTSQGPVQAQVTGSRDVSEGFQQNSSAYNTDLSGFMAYNAGAFGKLSYSIEGSKGKIGLPSGTPVPISEWNGDLERQANDLNAESIETDRNNRLQYTNRVGPVNLTSRIANNIKDLDTFEFGSETLIRTEGRNAFQMVEIPGQGALGYEFYERRLDSNVYGSHRGDAWGTFYEASFIHNDWIHLTPGVRYDRDNSYGESWSPRALLVIKPKDSWKISASASRSFQAPTFADLYNPFVPAQFAPTSLSPEITWTYDLGLEVTPTPHLGASLSLFRSDTKDRIALDPNRGFAAFNLNRAYSEGGEAAITYDHGILRQKLGYSYLWAVGQDNANGDSRYKALAFSPRHKADYRTDVSLPWQTTTTADVIYVYKQWTDIDQSGVEIPDYVVVNARLSKKIGWAELFVACNNVLNRHYAETADAFEGFFPQPGRNFLGGMTVHFLK